MSSHNKSSDESPKAASHTMTEHEIRSAAAKKGWETRHQHEQEAAQHQGESDAENRDDRGHRSHHDADYEGKNPNRVEGGKKAAETRGQTVHDDDEGHHVANYDGKNPNRVEGGKKAAETRAGGHRETNAEGKDPVFVEMGKKGAAARWGEESIQEGNDRDAKDSTGRSHHTADYEGKNPNRVEGGKKAAEKRGQHVHGEGSEKTAHKSGEDMNDVVLESDDEAAGDNDGKDPNRVRAGKIAAAKHYGKDYGEGFGDSETGNAAHNGKHSLTEEDSGPDPKHARFAAGGSDQAGKGVESHQKPLNIQINVARGTDVNLTVEEGSASESTQKGKH